MFCNTLLFCNIENYSSERSVQLLMSAHATWVYNTILYASLRTYKACKNDLPVTAGEGLISFLQIPGKIIPSNHYCSRKLLRS